MKYFLDCGANIGQTFEDHLIPTGKYSDHHIICFEPTPRHFAELLERVSKFAHLFQSITVCPFALGKTYGFAKMFHKTDARADSMFEEFWLNEPMEYQVLTATVPLSEFIRRVIRRGEDEMEIKIDIEGGEYLVLLEFLHFYGQSEITWPKINKIWVEWHKLTDQSQKIQDTIMLRATELGLDLTWWPH